MKARTIPRREFLNSTAWAALIAAAGLSGCTKTVTKYRPDGTPYTEEKDDWVATLAAIVILCIVAGVMAASKNNDSDGRSSMDYNGNRLFPEDDKGKIQFASMTSRRIMTGDKAVEKIFVTDNKGKLLVTADQFEHIENQNMEMAKSILATSQIFDLQKPIVICLKQTNLNLNHPAFTS